MQEKKKYFWKQVSAAQVWPTFLQLLHLIILSIKVNKNGRTPLSLEILYVYICMLNVIYRMLAGFIISVYFSKFIWLVFKQYKIFGTVSLILKKVVKFNLFYYNSGIISIKENKCSDRSLDMTLPALGNYARPPIKPTNQPGDRHKGS